MTYTEPCNSLILTVTTFPCSEYIPEVIIKNHLALKNRYEAQDDWPINYLLILRELQAPKVFKIMYFV